MACFFLATFAISLYSIDCVSAEGSLDGMCDLKRRIVIDISTSLISSIMITPILSDENEV